MIKSIKILAILAILAAVVGSMTLYTVHETQTGILLEFGKPKKWPLQPGIEYRIPSMHQVVLYDARLKVYDAQAREVITKDKKNLKVDNYARWRIIDPLLFYEKVQTIYRAQERLDDMIYSLLREHLGQYTLIDIVANKRAEIMALVSKQANEAAAQYGIEVADVRIKRADLPAENAKHVYKRMQAERQRQAKRYRAEGDEVSRKVRSQADKERDIILAEAYRKAEEIRGLGDAEATRIYAEAYGKDTEFYAFTKSLALYQKAFKKDDILILSPNDPLLRYIKSDSPK